MMLKIFPVENKDDIETARSIAVEYLALHGILNLPEHGRNGDEITS